MSSGDTRRSVDYSGRPLGFYLTIGAFAAGLALILMILLTLSGFGGATQTRQAGARADDPLDAVRALLAHDANLSVCRDALEQVNVALANRPDDQRPPSLDPARRARLQQRFGLDDDDMNEVAAESYTLLDGWRLDEAFLLHDAATHVLETDDEGGALPTPGPLDRAKAAFAWAVREVRLAEPTDAGVVPPQFVLRRGSGTALERSLVFLDLLEQIGVADEEGRTGTDGAPAPLHGCLVFCHDRADGPARLWACGVVVGDGTDVYLFDPRLGLPLPGVNGAGVATLSAVCGKPALLEPLNAATGLKYDVTAEQARTAELDLVCSLSEMAPRMKHLEEKVLPPVRVRLARDPEADFARLESAARKTEGAKPAVKVWADGSTELRRFLPPDEGGVDPVRPFFISSLRGYADHAPDERPVQMQRYELFKLQLPPWDAMPRLFRNLNLFPYNVGLGQRVREGFAQTFRRLAIDPQGPRDRVLRGDFDAAAGDLVGMGARLRQFQERRADAGPVEELEKQVAEWAEKAGHAYADLLRAQEKGSPTEQTAAAKEVEEAWKDAGPVVTLLEGAAVGPGQAEVTYQLGLCKHEKAEQAQSRLDRLRRRPGAKEDQPDVREAQDDARAAWTDALGWWMKYGEDHPEESAERPSSAPGRAAAVRQMRARAHEMLGDWRAAAATYEDPTEPMAPLTKVAALYQARRVKKDHEAEKR